MPRVRVYALAIAFTVLELLVLAVGSSTNDSVPDFYTLKATDIDGQEISFEKFRGKITLVINIANACGYADKHYRSMGRLLDIIGPDNFIILAFPCNQFGQQEPGTSEDIKSHLIRNYGAEYLIFKKIDVVGGDAHPVYKNLAAQTNQAPDWNFWKYLINEDGKVMNSWGPKDRIEDIFLEVRAAVLRLQNIPPAKTLNIFIGNEGGDESAVQCLKSRLTNNISYYEKEKNDKKMPSKLTSLPKTFFKPIIFYAAVESDYEKFGYIEILFED